ncbi:hypothetical protein TruAng_008483 [Truncatella angustata]|nr:hypothetical protein TruAng_008483 [Truncatella angustata]
MASQELAIERLQLAVIDGRTENIRYRQNQIHSLHAALRNEAGLVCSALARDSQASPAEVETEYYLAMDTIRHWYETIDFAEEHKKEYLPVTEGKDNTTRRLGVGLVIIRPTSHTRFYSVVAPLAAAIAAGNCVILELEDTLLQVDSVLRKILPDALDLNTFCLSKTIKDFSILESAMLVDQTTSAASNTKTNQLLSATITRTVAVVDRTADVQAAAKAITNARFSFGGTSPYAPDLVLVNEFVKQEFFEACSKYATLAFAKESGIKKVSGNQSEATRKAVRDAEEKKQVSSFGSDDFKLVDVSDRTSPLAHLKISGRYLPIASVSGLVDAIFTEEFEYNKDMFSKARPQFIEAPPETFAMAEELLLGSKKTTTSAIRTLAVRPLKPTGQPGNASLGFFEAGFVTMASITLFGILPIVSYGAWVVGRKGFEQALRWRH